MKRISLVIGLVFIGNGLCQLFDSPAYSNEDDLMASAATLFGPKAFGIRHANLGNFGPFGYGGIGGMKMGKIGPLHYGHIGGIHANSFLGASNPNAGEEESSGGIATPSGNQYEGVVGRTQEQMWKGNDGQEQTWQQGIVGPENFVGAQQTWQGIDGQEQTWQQGIVGPENFVGAQQTWQGIDGQELWQGIDGDENFDGPEQNWQGIDGQENFVGAQQAWQGMDGEGNFEGAQQSWQGMDHQSNFVGAEQNWQGIDQPSNFLGAEQSWQGFDGQENFIGIGPNEQQALEVGPQISGNSKAFINEGLFGVKTDKFDKFDKFEKIPPKPAPPPKFPKHPPKFTPPPPPPPPPYRPPTYNYYGGYGSHGSGSSSGGYGGSYRYKGSHHGHGHSHNHGHGFNKFGSHKHGFNKFGSHHGHHGGHNSLIFRNDMQEFQRSAPQGYEMQQDQFQQFYEINNPIMPTTTCYYLPNIIHTKHLPQSRQTSARSSVDDILNGLDDIGFDFEFRDLIENVFLTPYLGLLDPNDLDDDTLLLL